MIWIETRGAILLKERDFVLGYVSKAQSGYAYSTDNPLEVQKSITLRGMGEPFTLEQAKDRLLEITTKKHPELVLQESEVKL